MRRAMRRLTLTLWARLYRLQEAEPALIAKLPRYLPELAPDWPVDQTFGVDVGASMGVYSLALAKWCRRVLAPESNPILAANLMAASWPKLDVICAAASNRTGPGMLVDASPGGWRHPEAKLGTDGAWRAPCELVRLSDLVKAPTALVVKIDVEGHEAAVLQGMRRLLDTPHAPLLIELEHRHNPSCWDLFDYLIQRGFQAFRFSRGQLSPAVRSDIPGRNEFSSGIFARFRGYRPNFVFLRSAKES